MTITLIAWIVGIIAAVMLFLMPFFVFKIRNEIVEMNQVNKRILRLIESVVPENKKPKTVTCSNCRTANEANSKRCSHCGDKLPG